MLVQYGAGLSGPAEWRNFDASPTLRLQRLPLLGPLVFRRVKPRFPSTVEYGDIVKGLPIKGDSCDAVYCSHVLEHLALDGFRIALRNTFQYLKPGGIFRFVLPDLEFLANSYLGDGRDDACLTFMRSSHLGAENRARTIIARARVIAGNSAHLTMWDFKGMRVELENTGFENVRRASIGDSPENWFSSVEDPGRWNNCLGVECRKPKVS